MAPIINTEDPRATKILDAAGVEYTIETPRKTDLVIPATNFWAIPDIHYRGKVSAYALSKKLLPARTQQQHAEHRNSAGENDFVTMDMPFYFAMFDALFKQRDDLEHVEQARSFIQRAMRQSLPIALTRFGYTPKGEDIVTHNYGTNESYQVRENIVGPDRFIQIGDKKALTAILGTGDVSRINKIFNWINESDAYIHRLNEKPQKETEAVAWLLAGPGIAGVNCIGHPDYAFASLGVRVHARSA